MLSLKNIRSGSVVEEVVRRLRRCGYFTVSQLGTPQLGETSISSSSSSSRSSRSIVVVVEVVEVVVVVVIALAARILLRLVDCASLCGRSESGRLLHARGHLGEEGRHICIYIYIERERYVYIYIYV